MGHVKIFQHRAFLSISLLLDQHFPWLLQSLEIETPCLDLQNMVPPTVLVMLLPALISKQVGLPWQFLCHTSVHLFLRLYAYQDAQERRVPQIPSPCSWQCLTHAPSSGVSLYLIHWDWRHLSVSLHILVVLFNSRWKKARMSRNSILLSKANSVPQIFTTHRNFLHEIYFKMRKISITFCM